MKSLNQNITDVLTAVRSISERFNITDIQFLKMCIRETKLEWTNEKKTSFSKDYPTMPTARLIKKYHVSEKAINVMASKLKLKKENYWWSPEDCQRLKENYNATGTGMQELLEMFPGKTKWAIINKYRELTNKR